MSPWLAYLLGIISAPILAAAVARAIVTWGRFTRWLDARWGLVVEASFRRGEGVSDWTLKNDIWWERNLGPLLVGGWYREPHEGPPLATRWLGIGSGKGPHLMFLRRRAL